MRDTEHGDVVCLRELRKRIERGAHVGYLVRVDLAAKVGRDWIDDDQRDVTELAHLLRQDFEILLDRERARAALLVAYEAQAIDKRTIGARGFESVARWCHRWNPRR